VPIEDRLDLAEEAEPPRRAVERLERPRPGGHRLAEASDRRGRVLVLVAADARGGLARLERDPAPHRLDHMPLGVERLEVERRSRRDREAGRAVLVDPGRAQDSLHVPRPLDRDRRAGQRRARRPAVLVAADPGRAKLEGNHAQGPDRLAIHALQSRAAKHVVQIDGGRRRAVIDAAGTGRRLGPWGQRHRLTAGNARVRRQKLPLPIDRHPIDPEPLRPIGPERHQELRLAQRKGILELVAGLPVRVHVNRRRRTHRGDQSRPLVLLAPAARVESPQPALLERVMPAENAHDLARPRNRPRVENRRGKPRVVAVDLRLAAAVGIHLEQPLGIDLPPVVVVPAGIEDAAVGSHSRVVGVHLIEGELPQVPALQVAREEVAHLGPPAIDRLYAARGIEEDVAAGQVNPLVVGEP